MISVVFPPARAAAPALPLAGFTLRAASAADLPFLTQLHADLRAAEFAMIPWPDAQKRAFIQSQFEMQHIGYVARFPDADFWIVERTSEPAGLLYLDRSTPHWRIIDIALVPAVRGGGTGTQLIGWIQDAARAAGAEQIALSVLVTNPRAWALYRRLGFAGEPEHGAIQIDMTWHA